MNKAIWTGPLARMVGIYIKYSLKVLKGRGHSEDLAVNVHILLKCEFLFSFSVSL
jgi:hypothetical protein